MTNRISRCIYVTRSVDFSRFQWIKEGGTRLCPGWAWTSHQTYDSHIPDRFTVVHFSDEVVGAEVASKVASKDQKTK